MATSPQSPPRPTSKLAGVSIAATLLFVVATEVGLRPGQRMLEVTSEGIALLLAPGEAAATYADQEHFVAKVTKRSEADFKKSYGEFLANKPASIPAAAQAEAPAEAIPDPVEAAPTKAEGSRPDQGSATSGAPDQDFGGFKL